jgi:hypothetical protein
VTRAQALAQSKSSVAGPKRALESGCLGYFHWSSVVVVPSGPGDDRARSSAVVSQPQPPTWLLIVILIAVEAFG